MQPAPNDPASNLNQPDAFPDAALEAAFQSDLRLLESPAPSGNQGAVLLGTMGLFVLTQLGRDQTLVGIAAIVGVLLFHELGHLLGMKLFGYRNVKMFFIPFFGAAVSGKRQGGAGWKEAVVLLLGPLPGIVLGLGLAFKAQMSPSPVLMSVATVMVMVNAFNLIPIMPLDGGRFFHLLLFCRHRYLEMAFTALATVLLMAGGLLGMIILPILGVFMLLALPMQWRQLKAVEGLRSQFGQTGQWGGPPSALPQPQLREAFMAAHAISPVVPDNRPRQRVTIMESLIERAAMTPPGIAASLTLLLPWLLGVVFSIVAAMLLRVPDWREYKVAEGGFSVMLPAQVEPFLPIERNNPFGVVRMQGISARGSAGEFMVRWYDLPNDRLSQGGQGLEGIQALHALTSFLDGWRDKWIQRSQGVVVSEAHLPNGRQVRIRESEGQEYFLRILIDGRRVYLLHAPVKPEGEANRFFESFRFIRP